MRPRPTAEPEAVIIPPEAGDVARQADLERIERLAHWLDDRFRLPGTDIRVGLDGLLGLIPGVGDTATGLLSAYIVLEAWRLGVPNGKLARMAGNVLVDLALGSIPVLGDVFDIGFKANRRNVKLLRRHLLESPKPHRI